MASKYDRKPIKERLLNLIDKKRDCWEWTGSIDNKGYGRLTTGSRSDGSRRTRGAHRVSYETFVGEVPKGLELDHLCRNTLCINPDHLEAVTHKENMHRGNPSWKQQIAKTHCPHGHEYSEDNLYRYGNTRNCKTCMKARSIRVNKERGLLSLAK